MTHAEALSKVEEGVAYWIDDRHKGIQLFDRRVLPQGKVTWRPKFSGTREYDEGPAEVYRARCGVMILQMEAG